MIYIEKREVVWDLSEMFPSATDPSVQKALDDLTRLAGNFVGKYQGKIKRLSAEKLLVCIKNYEEYFAKLECAWVFARLSFMANMTISDIQLLYDKVNKKRAELDKMLAFFNIEIGNLVHENSGIINEQVLQNYRHFFERLGRQNLHNLSEVEEKLIIEKDQFGVNAWQELQGKWSGTRSFEVEVEGKKKTVSLGEAFGLMFHPDRPTRKSATKSMFDLLGKDGEIFASALRNICNDWLTVCERRKYGSPMEASLIANDIDQQTINNLLTYIVNHTDLYHRYLRLKAKILKLPRLCGHDVHAPTPDAPDTKFDYDRARSLIIEAYSRFDEEYASAVKDMFAKKHIDATPRLGKMANRGSCYHWYEGKSAFVIMHFNGMLIDVYTLAHELGHATHAYYYTRNQAILNCGTPTAPQPMILAETASTFGELLLTDLLRSQIRSDQGLKAILCGVLDSANLSIYGTATMALFEQSLYDTIKRGEYLDYRTICRCYVEARDKIDGDAIEYSEEEEAFWTAVPHYYMPNFRFYNYPYVYAQLFVYALYQKYLEEGKEFVPKFKKVLSAGCSISPLQIGEILGLDIADAHFWELGLKQYEHLLEELEKAVS